MTGKPDISCCANMKCGSEFMRLGEGRLVVFLVDDPEAWGLPEHAKQKAVWLCDACAPQKHIRLDLRHHAVHLIRKYHTQASAAA